MIPNLPSRLHFKLTGLVGLSLLILSCASHSRGSDDRPSNGPSGTSDAEASGAVHSAFLSVHGTQREFSYYIPSGTPDQRLPVVIYLHGHGDSMRHILGKGHLPSASSQWMDVAEREKFLVLYPLGLKGEGRRGKTGWNDCRLHAKGNPTGDDVGFVKRLIEYAVDHHHGDPKRVYVTGMSNGGHMTMRIAMEMSEVVAAVAPIVALLPKVSQCSGPTMPVPILMMHGTEDPLAPFAGGSMPKGRGEVFSARETAQAWVKWNGLDEVPEKTATLPDRDPSDHSTILVRAREHQASGNAVIAYEMHGAGHTQPSIEAKMGRLLERIQGNQNRDIEMAEAVWKFFQTRSR